MKATLEKIRTVQDKTSIHYFERIESSFPPYWHFHPELELTFIFKGRGMRYVGNSILPYREHDLVLLGGNLPHQWVSDPKSDYSKQHAYVFQFETTLFQNIMDFEPLEQLFKEARQGLYFPSPSNEIIQKLLEFNENKGVPRFLAFVDLLVHLEASKEKIKLADQLLSPSKSGLKISRVSAYILENLHRKITLQELADISNLQPESFCRWFKKQMGVSFTTFANKARIEDAFQQLIQTDASISQIAYQSGFDTLAHFNRTFKKFKSASPRKLREQLKS